MIQLHDVFLLPGVWGFDVVPSLVGFEANCQELGTDHPKP